VPVFKCLNDPVAPDRNGVPPLGGDREKQADKKRERERERERE